MIGGKYGVQNVKTGQLVNISSFLGGLFKVGRICPLFYLKYLSLKHTSY